MTVDKKGKRWRRAGASLLVLITLLVAARLALPTVVRHYVNRALDRNQAYDGRIGDIHVHLWRGAYSIEDLRLTKATGGVPVPFFTARRVELGLDTLALLHGRIVGRIELDGPELNFVDGAGKSGSQTGAGGPWLAVISDLYPFDINSTRIHDAKVRFRAFDTSPPVDVYLSGLEGSIENLTNIRDEVTPLFSTVSVKGTAMDEARFEYEMKLDPFSYRPTFQMALRLLGLDVTKTNSLARAYGNFDFEQGWFDLVVELDVKEGAIRGYVKPLFRDLVVFDLEKDVRKNPLAAFWEALVGVAASIFRNPARDQVATVIPVSGYIERPDTDVLATLGNMLRNAFVRAYLPRFQGTASEISVLKFEPGAFPVAPETMR